MSVYYPGPSPGEGMSELVGVSAAHRRTLERVVAAAANDAEVLIVGPSGVGKELYARMIHDQSKRAQGPFVAVNCGAIPTELFENEMFGHVGGAFTGARTDRPGLAREAERGTLFLDEIDSLHLANQVKLLRLIQEREYRPLGEARARKVDIRLIAATNADLTAETFAKGRFRQDLFFRLRVIPIEVPALRERQEDVGPLLAHFLARYSSEYGCEKVTLTPEAYQRLDGYHWPGNVRELENCARYLVCTHAGKAIGPEDLPLLTVHSPASGPRTFQSAKREVVRDFERQFLEQTLAEHEQNISAAARASGKHRRAFFELMRRHGLTQRKDGDQG
jgi:DNA-binding NtrC family response regulator